MRYIGLDPGDAWLGFAVLDAPDETTLFTTCGVLHVPSRGGLMPVTREIRGWLPAFVVSEDFRLRGLGHQQWSRGMTARLLGALQFAVEDYDSDWSTVDAGDPIKDLKALGADRWIDRWSPTWPRERAAEWKHARSAWRAVGMHLLRDEDGGRELLRRLIRGEKFRVSARMFSVRGVRENELVSPTAVWT